MSLMWVPFPGDGAGLTGPVHQCRWIFESDFWYADRPDVMVSSMALQLCDVEAWEQDAVLEEGGAVSVASSSKGAVKKKK